MPILVVELMLLSPWMELRLELDPAQLLNCSWLTERTSEIARHSSQTVYFPVAFALLMVLLAAVLQLFRLLSWMARVQFSVFPTK